MARAKRNRRGGRADVASSTGVATQSPASKRSPPEAAGVSERNARVAVAALIALHGALLVWAAVRNSVAYDEFAHLPAGVAYLRHGELSIYNQTPPLLRWWGAWPALLAGGAAP